MGEDYTKQERRNARDEMDSQQEEFVEWLENQEHIGNVSDRMMALDFTIGSRFEDWPSSLDDDELSVIANSSVQKTRSNVRQIMDHKFFKQPVVHLPPIQEEQADEIEEMMNVEEPFFLHFGSRALGGIPAPDGVITPHVQSNDPVTLNMLKLVVSQALDVWIEVYECGDNVVKSQDELE